MGAAVMPNGIRVSEATIRLTVIPDGAVTRDTRIGRSRDVQFCVIFSPLCRTN